MLTTRRNFGVFQLIEYLCGCQQKWSEKKFTRNTSYGCILRPEVSYFFPALMRRDAE